MAKYRYPGTAADFRATIAALKAARAEYEPDELQQARARSDAFLAEAERERAARSSLFQHERNLALLHGDGI